MHGKKVLFILSVIYIFIFILFFPSCNTNKGIDIPPDQLEDIIIFFVDAEQGGQFSYETDILLTLDIPPNALSEDTEIAISKASYSSNQLLYMEKKAIGPIIEVKPHGLFFNTPIKVSIDVSSIDISDFSYDDLQVFSSDGTTVEPLTTTRDGSLYTVYIEHFSILYLRLKEGISLFGGSEFTSDDVSVEILNNHLSFGVVFAETSVHVWSYILHEFNYPSCFEVMYQIQLFKRDSVISNVCILTKQSYRIVYRDKSEGFEFIKHEDFEPQIDQVNKPNWKVYYPDIYHETGIYGREMVVVFDRTNSPGDPSLNETKGPFSVQERELFLEEVFSNNIQQLISLSDLNQYDDNLTGLDIEPDKKYFRIIRDICNKYDVLFITDEIQTGFGRTGKRWGCDHYAFQPDIMVVGKAMGGGLPISATIFRKDILPSDFRKKAWHTFTFSGAPIICATALAAVGVVIEEKLPERAAKTGYFMMQRLKSMQEKHPLIGDVRAKGLFIGVELVKNKKTKEKAVDETAQVLKKSEEKGVLFGISSLINVGNVIKIKPPLNITEDIATKILDIFEEAVSEVEDVYI